MRITWRSFAAWIGAPRVTLSHALGDATHGMIATAGIVEGFTGAGLGRTAVFVATFTALLAGAFALGGVAYVEAAADRDADRAWLGEERRRIADSPESERAALADHYRAKGLPTDLADQVAFHLSRRDALAAHADADRGIGVTDAARRPAAVAVLAAVSFAAGAVLPMLVAVLVDDGRRAPLTFAAVAVLLATTAYVQARADHAAVPHTIARTVGIGVVAMLASYLIGSAFQP